jgi:diguanylate cyclase (GGDEF)-like protein
MNGKYKEIDTTLRGLNHSTDAHYKWLVTILRFVARRDVELAEITYQDAHHHCEFGQWLNEKLNEQRDDQRYLLDINTTHIEVHQTCRELVAAIEIDGRGSVGFKAFEHSLLAFTESLSRYKEYLIQLRTSYDALTGLPSRRVLDGSFDSLSEALSAKGLYLLLLDVDHFKKINDNYGHLNGDVILRTLAFHLSDNIRRNESVYRYGGEEFIIMLQAENDRQAAAAAERIRRTIAGIETQVGEQLIRITFTSGLTRVMPGEVLREVLERADMALYKGKNSGRNCTVMIHRGQEMMKIEA